MAVSPAAQGAKGALQETVILPTRSAFNVSMDGNS